MSKLIEQLRGHAATMPNAPAIIEDRSSAGAAVTTYGELLQHVERFARAYHRRAADADFIPIYAGKSVHSVAAVLAALMTGKAFVVLNRKLRLPQIEGLLKAMSAKLLILDGGGIMTLRRELTDSLHARAIPWWVMREHAWSGPHDKAVETLRESIVLHHWPDDLSEDIEHAIEALEHDHKRPGCCLFTSGSTGVPKGVLIAASDLDARAEAEVECFGLSPDDVLLNVLPWSFDVGLNQLLSSIWTGATLVLTDSWLPADVLRMAAEHGVTGISSVPAVWKDIMNAGLSFDTAGEHKPLRYITVSGGDLSTKHLDRLPAMVPGVGIFKTYGQTEAFRATVLRPEFFETKRGSCGQPFGSARVYIVRDNGTPAEPNEPGQVVHSGLGVMLGYLGGADTASKLRPNPFHGSDDPAEFAIFSGDRGHMDEHGFVYLHGRADGMLKVMGNRVYPEEVAAAMHEIEGVHEAEVLGVKDEDGLATLVAFVTGPTLSAEDDRAAMLIQRELARRLPSYMVPQRVVMLPTMPRTGSGKTDRPALLKQAERLLAE